MIRIRTQKMSTSRWGPAPMMVESLRVVCSSALPKTGSNSVFSVGHRHSTL